MIDALILGAGAAGLSASRALHNAGKRVVVLEARDRIGGRAWTVHGALDSGTRAAGVVLKQEFGLTKSIDIS